MSKGSSEQREHECEEQGAQVRSRSREQERRSAGSREQGAGAQEHGEQGAA